MSSLQKNKPRSCLILVISLLLMLSCNLPINRPAGSPAANPPGTPGAIQTAPGAVRIEIQAGESLPLAQGVLGTQGGVLRVDNPGGALDGLQIMAPPGAWPADVSFSISAAPVSGHNLAPDIRVASPLITVETSSTSIAGELIADTFLQVTLPLDNAPDEFAMLFIYDDSRGTLEALPMLSQDGTHLTALTRHFSKVIILESDKPALDRLNLQTGFIQGVHNWQFTNHGSAIAPKGHCAGQVITALYYYEMTGGEALYGVYDAANNLHPATPGFDFDDRLGYRLASSAQKRASWDTDERQRWYEMQTNDDELTYYSFALALRANGLPQYVEVRYAGGGHALIVYEKFGDRFYVSDPNYPAPSARRAIVYDRSAKKFKPYYSGPTAADSRRAYPNIYYLNKSFVLTQIQFEALWAQFATGVVGDDLFPSYSLSSVTISDFGDIDYIPLTNQNNVAANSVEVELHLDGLDGRLRVYNDALELVGARREMSAISLPLPGAQTRYLFAVYKKIGTKWRYIDGRWITFNKNYTGSWDGGLVCSEQFETRYRWQVSLIQDDAGNVSGTVHFHDCPDGGQSVYHVTGQVAGTQAGLTLEGVQVGATGKLGENTPKSQTFTFSFDALLQPNFTP